MRRRIGLRMALVLLCLLLLGGTALPVRAAQTQTAQAQAQNTTGITGFLTDIQEMFTQFTESPGFQSQKAGISQGLAWYDQLHVGMLYLSPVSGWAAFTRWLSEQSIQDAGDLAWKLVMFLAGLGNSLWNGIRGIFGGLFSLVGHIGG